MGYTVPHFINGKPFAAVTPRFHTLFNPACGEAVGQVYFADQSICHEAIASAKAAWPEWAKTTAIKRARVLFKFRELLETYKLDLANIITREQGKTIEDAKGSIARAVEIIEFHCGLVQQLQGSFSSEVSLGMDCYTLRQPLGVCVGVSPFNFPIMVPIWMMIPAIACGNTFILKPSEQDPSASIRLLELLSDAGLPDGVVNCVHGDQWLVDELLAHPDIAAITAVASTPVAESIYTKATGYGKRAHTFGGAKNHALIMPDADFEQAAQAIVGAAFGSAGERCMAISVLVIVGKDTAEPFLDTLKPKINAIRVDAGEVKGCDMGPVISHAHRDKIIAAIDKGVEEGAELLIDGRAFKHKEFPQGFYLGPSLFDQVNESMSIYNNEIFGPVLVIVRVNTFEDALALVNRNQYGNGTAIFTRDGHLAREYIQRVQVGMVGVNVPIPVPIANHPFGGWKRSSFGDTNMHGLESIHFYTRRKTITSKWPTSQLEGSLFVMPVNQ